jgi:hypothetical protein
MKLLAILTLALVGCNQSGNVPTKLNDHGQFDYGDIDLEIKSIQVADSTITIFNNGFDSIPLYQISLGIREMQYSKGCINTGYVIGPSGYLRAKEEFIKKHFNPIQSTDYFEINYDKRIKEANRTNNCKLGSNVSVDCCEIL